MPDTCLKIADELWTLGHRDRDYRLFLQNIRMQ